MFQLRAYLAALVGLPPIAIQQSIRVHGNRSEILHEWLGLEFLQIRRWAAALVLKRPNARWPMAWSGRQAMISAETSKRSSKIAVIMQWATVTQTLAESSHPQPQHLRRDINEETEKQDGSDINRRVQVLYSNTPAFWTSRPFGIWIQE